jgi:cytochrome o ubiquinol oxidase operon protein cyoD
MSIDSNHPSKDRGTSEPYIVGFILSLLFTIIPYVMVVNKLVTGHALLGLILGIAVIQMIIQIVFFLHLGRERKPRWQLYFFGGTVIGILTVVGGSVFIMSHLHSNMSPIEVTQKLTQDEGISQIEGAQTGACQEIHTEFTVTIKNGVFSPAHVDAQKCDALVFTSVDDSSHQIAFGTQPDDLAYAGQKDISITKEHGQLLILSQPGSYQYYDYLHPDIVGSFIVSQ